MCCGAFPLSPVLRRQRTQGTQETDVANSIVTPPKPNLKAVAPLPRDHHFSRHRRVEEGFLVGGPLMLVQCSNAVQVQTLSRL